MRDENKCTNPSSQTVPTLSGGTPPSAFSPTFLAHLRDQDETLTASEAAVAGPWQSVPVPGWPGLVAVVREWECPGEGDRPEGLFCQEETARMFAAILPLVEREPLFHLAETPEGEAGFAVSAVYGEQGPCTVGWLRRSEPELIAALHLAEALVRRPASLAVLLQVAGSGALEQIGRILAPVEAGEEEAADG
jgi:hypothetical protein